MVWVVLATPPQWPPHTPAVAAPLMMAIGVPSRCAACYSGIGAAAAIPRAPLGDEKPCQKYIGLAGSWPALAVVVAVTDVAGGDRFSSARLRVPLMVPIIASTAVLSGSCNLLQNNEPHRHEKSV
jgi:hypothetical protein